MIIEALTVKNWRGYREPHTFQFESGINLVLGRNEAGKSTLFEALIRVLFDRHKAATEEIRAIQPIGSSLGPEATLFFKSDGARYKVEKRFLENPGAKLFCERNGRFELDHEGDKADAKLRDILHGEVSSRSAAHPEHRGMAQALWYLQSDRAIPEKDWSEGVKEGLQGLVKLAARSPVEEALAGRLSKVYSEFWTPATGRVAANSELDQLASGILGLEATISELQSKAQAVERYRGDLEEFQSLGAQKVAELVKAKAELAELSTLIQEADQAERAKEAQERLKVGAEEAANRIRGELSRIDELQARVLDRRKDARKLEETLFEKTSEAKEGASVSEIHARRWKEQLQPALKDVEAELRALHSVERLRKLQKDQDRLATLVGKCSDARTKLQDRRKERAELLAPDVTEWKSFSAISKQSAVLSAQVEASAIRVTFKLEDKKRKVTSNPEAREAKDGEFIVAEPTEFRIQGVGAVGIRSGATSLKELVAQKAEVEQGVSLTLTRFGAKDAEDLAKLFERGRDLDRIITALEADLEEKENVEPDAEKELARVRRGIQEETRSAAPIPKDVQEQGGTGIRQRIAGQEKEKDRLIREIDQEQESEAQAQRNHLAIVGARETASNKLAERKAEIQTLEEGVATALKSYGTLEHLRRLVAAADEAKNKAAATLGDLLKAYDAKVKTPRRLHLQAEKRVQELDGQTRDLENKLTATLARIEESAAQGNYSRSSDVEIELRLKKERLEVVQRRAEAAKLLQGIVNAYERQRAAALSGPIRELVDGWLQILTEGNYDAILIDDKLKPAGVHMPRYGADLPITSLSYGTQEQLVVLLRLAIGVLLSSKERNLVVIDDRLVNADAVRIKRLCLILQEASKSCQVVIASTNDTPYAGLGAHIVRVPADGLAPPKAAEVLN